MIVRPDAAAGQPQPEAEPRVLGRATGLDDAPAGPHLVGERRLDEHLLRRKAAVEGRGTHSRATSDLAHGDPESVLGEQRASRIKNSIAVLPRVGAKQMRHLLAHPSHFLQVDASVH